jgi:hypothetical protein
MANDNNDQSGKSEPKLTDSLKKVFTAGVSAAFMTEESLRTYLQDLKLPKEILNVLLQGASKTKDEIANRVTQEMLGILKKVDVVKEFSKFAEDHKFKITAEIDIIKKNKESDVPTSKS